MDQQDPFIDGSGRDENFFNIDGNQPLRELRKWGYCPASLGITYAVRLRSCICNPHDFGSAYQLRFNEADRRTSQGG